MTKIRSSRHLAIFSCIRSSKSRTKFDYNQLIRLWSKIGHIQSSRSRPTNLVESTLTEIWLIKPLPKCGHIWPSRHWPKFGRIRQNRPWPKFSGIQSSLSQLKFCRVDLSPNLVMLSPIEICSKVVQVHPMLKFGLVGPDKKSIKFYVVSPMDTSFKKFMKNGFWILNLIQIFRFGFKLDLNIWIWI